MSLEVTDIHIRRFVNERPIGGSDTVHEILIDTGKLHVHPRQIFTLEGENKSGKSTIVKALSGVFSDAAHDTATGEIESSKFSMSISLLVKINGEPKKIRTVQEAQRHGIVAVFQDDELIPSMTAAEQILLRHGKQPFLSVAKPIARVVDGALGILPRTKDLTAERLLDKTFPKLPSGNSSDVTVPVDENALLAKAQTLFESFGAQFGDTLNSYPTAMSGGEKAVARIVSALMTPNIKYLFLDEVFRGVQKDVWPKIIGRLRELAFEQGIAIVAISHVADEIFEWRPDKRFLIEGKKLAATSTEELLLVSKAIPNSVKTTVVMELTRRSGGPGFSNFDINLIASFKSPSIVFVDDKLIGHDFVQWLIADLNSNGIETIIIPVEGGEQSKSRDYAFSLIDAVFEKSELPIGGFFVIGGGTVLNVCAFVCSLIARGIYPTVLVPTTIMALADVAIGSKTAVNIPPSGGDRVRTGKHSIGTYHNPAAVLVCKEVISFDDKIGVLSGLSEILKHGIALSEERADRAISCIKALQKHRASDTEIYNLAVWTMQTKADILSADPYELNSGRILQIGHLHAHSLETASNFEIPHGIALYWGLLVDAILTRKLLPTNSGRLQPIVEALIEIMGDEVVWSTIGSHISEDLLKYYFADTKRYHRDTGGFNILAMKPYDSQLESVTFSEGQLVEAISEAKALIYASI